MANITKFVRFGNGQGTFIDTEVTSTGNYPVEGKGIYSAIAGAVSALPYLTEAPTEANPNGLQIVVLDADPDTKYSGYIYFITEE